MSIPRKIPKMLIDILDYDAESGIFAWKCNCGGNGCVKAGTRAGAVGASGYRYIKFRRKLYREHRIAYEFINGPVPDGYEVDHINGDRGDNRICNLRAATHQENIINGRNRKNNTSGKKGVSLHTDGRWRARLHVGGKSIHLGLFLSVDEAHLAYMKAATERFGKFARSS